VIRGPRRWRIHRTVGPLAVAVSLAAACGDAGAPQAHPDWPTARPADVGMDADTLEAAHRHIRNDLPNVNALLVVRQGKLVFERYYGGTDRETLLSVRSITKSVVGAMTGVALARGWLDSLGQRLPDVLPAYFDAGVPAARRDVTLRHLLTMSSGLAYDSLGADPIVGSWVSAYVHGPSITPPGEAFLYDSSNPHLLSAAITVQAGKALADLADETLFGALDIRSYAWLSDPEGFSNGSTGIYMMAADWAKLGELYLRDGVWDGERLLPVGWVEASTTPSFDLTAGDGYGYLWWTVGGLHTRIYAAVGYRQQWILVLPEFDLVVVIASETTDLRGPETDHFHLLYRYVLPAIPGAPVPP
jgi:CubicO group peptidase (beta-lactamase class C family)